MTDASGASGPRDRVLELLGTGRAACNGYDRSDLVPRLDAAQSLVIAPSARVVVCGDYKQGKSSLINALLGTPLCPVDDDVATAVPTSIFGTADEPRFGVVLASTEFDEQDARRAVQRHEAMAAVTQPVFEGRRVEAIEAWLPEAPSSLSFVDTPGTGGLSSPHAKATLASVTGAAATIFVSDASQEYTRPELEFLAECRARCSQVILVLTKIDLHPHWRTILDTNQAHLHNAGIDSPIVTVSAELHAESQRSQMVGLADESGIPALRDYLHRSVGNAAVIDAHRSAADEVRLVVEQLQAPFQHERQMLTDPARRQQALSELEAAETRASALRTAASRWQIMLNDGMSDLMSDIDHDFRGRMRSLAAEANALVEEGSPSDMWPELGPWLEQRVAESVLANFDLLNERADTLNRSVGSLFADDAGEVTADLDSIEAESAMGRLSALENPDFSGESKLTAGIAAARGGSSGVFMFNTVAGVALGASALTALPVVALTAVIAFVSGRGALRQGNERQLTQQRTAARTAIRAYTDDVSFRIAKELQAIMRQTQRSIRDHYAVRADELHKTALRSLEAARAATNQGEGSARVRDIDAELARLANLEAAVTAVRNELR